jgi:ubiquinone/menaquinone biosynthesis C-methylase UbiE
MRFFRSRTPTDASGEAKHWDAHVDHMEELAASAAFIALRDRVIDLARLRADDRVLDVGAGTGLLALAAAPGVSRVSALDISPAMCERLRRKVESAGIANVEVLIGTATSIPLATDSVDAVISNYCLHHLDDSGKRQALTEMARVLRPGGRLAFADMMFDLQLSDRRNRVVIGMLIKRVLSRGPAGLLRLIKNGARIATGRWERPATIDWWREALQLAGFTGVVVEALDHEGGIACALAPLTLPHASGQRSPAALAGTPTDAAPRASGAVALP